MHVLLLWKHHRLNLISQTQHLLPIQLLADFPHCLTDVPKNGEVLLLQCRRPAPGTGPAAYVGSDGGRGHYYIWLPSRRGLKSGPCCFCRLCRRRGQRSLLNLAAPPFPSRRRRSLTEKNLPVGRSSSNIWDSADTLVKFWEEGVGIL